MERASVFVDSTIEANKHKWIQSEKAGHDVGDGCLQEWVRDHWWDYLRARWLEHLQGTRFWVEIDRGDYGLLKHQFIDEPILLDRILDRLKSGQENLNVIQWALDWGIPMSQVIRILEALDINSRRIVHHFENAK
jgi:hypothetical protein